MPVLMTLRVTASGQKLEAHVKDNPDVLRTIVARAKEHGLISHKFWARDDEILVVDTWPDRESFQKFFDSTPQIAETMAAAGASGPPEVSFWEALETGDDAC
ncbi:MAG: hypothetical protein ACRDYB_14705 [Acidimicrobiales bacterium]